MGRWRFGRRAATVKLDPGTADRRNTLFNMTIFWNESSARALTAQLSDLRLTDGPTGIAAITRIREFLDPALVIVTGHPEPLVRGRSPDKAALVLKPFLPEALHRAVEAAVSARIWGIREAG